MAKKNGSCLKKLVIGCGGLIGLVVLFVALITLVGFSSQPDPSEFTTLDTMETFSSIQEQGLNLPGGDAPPPKPVRLKLDMRMVDFRLKPHDVPGKIRVESNYDRANFELTSHVTDKKDHVEYELRFRNKHNVLGMLAGTKDKDFNPEDLQNKVTLYVPRDLLLELDYQIKMGSVKMDLSGLAVAKLKGRFSMGENRISMKEPNQTRMEVFDLVSEMGETRLRDVQNYRYSKGRIRGKMGEMSINHSGPYTEDASLRVLISMGEVRLQKPPKTNLNHKVTVIFGGTRTPRTESPDLEQATLTLAGRATFGEFRISGPRRQSPREKFTEDLDIGNTDEVIALYRLSIEQSPEKALGRGDLNSVGYDFLGNDEYEKAIAVLKLNTELHDDYANGFDSLGEAYMKYGDTRLAIANYERALDMDPHNSNAVNKLKKLRRRVKNDASESE